MAQSLFEKLIVAQLFKNSPHFTESEGSLLRSQDPATGTYPVPVETNLYKHSCPVSLRSTLI